MSKLSDFLTNIANAIRNLKGTTEPINAQNFANEINDMKEALDDTTATPEDIIVGKTAYVKGQKVDGSFDLVRLLLKKVCYPYALFKDDIYTDAFNNDSSIEEEFYLIGAPKKEILSSVQEVYNPTHKSMAYMFKDCVNLKKLPKLYFYSMPYDTNPTWSSYEGIFKGCSNIEKLTIGFKNRASLIYTFYGCTKLRVINIIDITGNDNGTLDIDAYVSDKPFYGCDNLETINGYVSISKNQFSNTFALTGLKTIKNITFKQITNSVQLASVSYNYGNLLTLESLLSAIQACYKSGSNTLTVGTANLNKLANVYVKVVDNTDTYYYPFEVCESTDDGAMTISQYLALKNWKIS